MDQKMIGSMISYERKKKKISLQVLADGICSVSALQRLEKGERLPDFFVLERIIERLGKSVNKIEFLYDESAYEIYYLRSLIERFIEESEYTEAEDALGYYENLPVAKDPIHRQYIYKMKAVVMSEKEKNHPVAIELFAKALEETVPNFSFRDMDERLLGEEELAILLLWVQERMRNETLSIVLDGNRVLSYIDRFCEDEEVKVNIYTKAAWVVGTWAIKRGENKDALWYTLLGEKVLADNKMLMHLPQFLDRILLLSKDVDFLEYIEWKKQRDALKQLYEEYNEVWDIDDIQLWKNYRQQEMYLISEAVEQERKLCKQSQEKLAHAVDMDQKTISRIESGKYKPKTGTVQKLREYLKIERDVCSTRIVVDDFHLLEMEREIAKLNTDNREKEAEVLYENLKLKLSLQWRENQQYIKYMDTVFDRQFGRCTNEQTIERCIEAFSITRNGISFDKLENVLLNRMETYILNYIGICYSALGDREKDISILRRIVNSYERSKVDLRYHYVAVSLLYTRLADLYEEVDRFDEAVEWCDKSIEFELACMRGIDIGYMLSEKRYTLDRKKGDNKNSKKVYMQAYQINKLMKRERKMINLQKAYMRWYDEEID